MYRKIIPLVFLLLPAICPSAFASRQVEGPDSLSLNYDLSGENPDSLSLSYDLSELIVEGRTQKVIKDGVEYIPAKKILNHSFDAASLLTNMSIPQVKVKDNSITTVSGQPFAIFIDYIAASENDLTAIRPQDVLRVEVLKFPIDPRFSGQENVINFIMRKSDWGGYTKINVYGRCLSTSIINGGVYQKIRLKNWTLDASVFAGADKTSGTETNSVEVFRGLSLGSIIYDNLTRESHEKLLRRTTNTQKATLKAAYNRDATYIAHTFSFNREAQPENTSDISTSYSVDIPSSSSRSLETSRSINFSAAGDYNFMFGADNFLKVDWTFAHSRNRNHFSRLYTDNLRIVNDNRELFYNPMLILEYSKGLGHDNRLSLKAATFSTFYNTGYSGSFSEKQNLFTNEDIIFIDYSHNFNFGMNLWVSLGGDYALARLNGERVLSKFNPRANIGLFYRLNSMNDFTLSTNLYCSHPEPFTVNNALVQSDEILWLKGNPTLGPSKKIYAFLSYNYIPKNWLQFSANVIYMRNKNFKYMYYADNNIGGIIRTFTDDNLKHSVALTFGSTVKLFNNSLILSPEGSLAREISTGYAPKSLFNLSGGIYVAYYLRNISASFLYLTPRKSLSLPQGDDAHGILLTSPNYVRVSVSYSLREFTASLSLSNWINSRHGKVTESIDTPVYSQTRSYLPSANALGLSLQLSYTIPYGKNVTRNEEVTNEAGKHSAILH